MSSAAVMHRFSKYGYGLDHNDSYLSYLPLAHVFEQLLFAMSTIYGIQCGFFGGDALKMVAEDMPALKPTFFVSVPRVFNRIFGVIQDKLNAAKKTEQGPFIEKAIYESCKIKKIIIEKDEKEDFIIAESLHRLLR